MSRWSAAAAGYFALDLGVRKEEALKTKRAVQARLEVRKGLPGHVHQNSPLPESSAMLPEWSNTMPSGCKITASAEHSM